VYRREAEGQRCREFRDMLDQREQERQGHSVSRVSAEPVSNLHFMYAWWAASSGHTGFFYSVSIYVTYVEKRKFKSTVSLCMKSVFVLYSTHRPTYLQSFIVLYCALNCIKKT
jgi:hypothetical protein